MTVADSPELRRTPMDRWRCKREYPCDPHAIELGRLTMQKIELLSASLLAAMLVALLPVAPAQALNNTSFVSSTGSGTACTRDAPCNNFQAAHDATFAAGEINCLDSGP